MKKSLFWLIAVVLILGAGFYLWSRPGLTPAPSAPPPVASEDQPFPSDAIDAPSAMRHPLPRLTDIRDDASTLSSPSEKPADPAASPAPPPALPKLAASDPVLVQALDGLLDTDELANLIHRDAVIRRAVLTVDNLDRHRLSLEKRSAPSPAGLFLVREQGDGYILSPENYARYTPYVHLAEAVDINQLVRLYVRYYPLFQQAYEDLGYPSRHFNDRLIEVIDHLLAAPRINGPIQLVRPHVLYRFSDPALEALSPGRKILVRMGPENADRIKARLRDLRQALTG